MTEFYLDTELTDRDIAYVARTCAASPYSLAELDRIMFCEVGPAFAPNLLSMAGEWAGWREEFIKERILQTHRRWFYAFYVLNPFKRFMRLKWGTALRQIAELRGGRKRNAL